MRSRIMTTDAGFMQGDAAPCSHVLALVSQTARIARGTRDVTRQSRRAVCEVLDERVRLALRRESLTTEQLVRCTGASKEDVDDAVKRAADAGHIVNVGIAEYPVWTWRLDPGAPREALHDMVRRLISERPSSIADLVAATGATPRDVSRAIGTLRRVARGRMVDMGYDGVARWLLT